ncbi:MAG: hypothetical protein JW866_00095 [Ignavibacteriales bacterium]|nr:hypothetical protein [Ignavibacteriales bacterium]
MFGLRKKKSNFSLETQKEMGNELRQYVEKIQYVPPTDKEIIEGLEFQDNYEAVFLITSLKKENANLKRKLTILQKKLITKE